MLVTVFPAGDFYFYFKRGCFMLEAPIWVASHCHHLRHVAGGRTDVGCLLASHLSVKEFTCSVCSDYQDIWTFFCRLFCPFSLFIPSSPDSLLLVENSFSFFFTEGAVVYSIIKLPGVPPNLTSAPPGRATAEIQLPRRYATPPPAVCPPPSLC